MTEALHDTVFSEFDCIAVWLLQVLAARITVQDPLLSDAVEPVVMFQPVPAFFHAAASFQVSPDGRWNPRRAVASRRDTRPAGRRAGRAIRAGIGSKDARFCALVREKPIAHIVPARSGRPLSVLHQTA